MKIERLSENQIRCTLNKADLADKELLLNELAYGTDKAKELFREMMQQASNELGFEIDDIPLMIEAIPVSPECLILIITKVEDPEELDTRFSRFSKPVDYQEYYEDEDDEDSEESEEDEDDSQSESSVASDNSIFDVIDNIVEDIGKAQSIKGNIPKAVPTKDVKTASTVQSASDVDVYKIFVFNALEDLEVVSKLLEGAYNGDNSLFKNPIDSKYYLIISRSNHSQDIFNKACNILSEYGSKAKTSYATPYYYKEHFKLIIKQHALQTLASL